MTGPPPRTILPVIIGIALTAALLVVLGYLARLRRNAEPATPVLTILHPGPEPVDSPLIVRFASTEPLELAPTGWVSGRWHLHARVNGAEYMPAATDLVSEDSIYTWTITAARRGAVAIQLGFANEQHREILSSRTAVVSTILR